MPPSANLVYGDVTHGQRVLSASGNPAAAAVDVVRGGGKSVSGTVISGSAGLEYGNVQDIFDTIDDLAKAFKPSEPGPGGTPPGQNPGDKPPGGIDIDIDWGEIIDAIDPELGPAIAAAAAEIGILGGVLALISAEGYGKAFVQADAPFVIGREFKSAGHDDLNGAGTREITIRRQDRPRPLDNHWNDRQPGAGGGGNRAVMELAESGSRAKCPFRKKNQCFALVGLANDSACVGRAFVAIRPFDKFGPKPA